MIECDVGDAVVVSRGAEIDVKDAVGASTVLRIDGRVERFGF